MVLKNLHFFKTTINQNFQSCQMNTLQDSVNSIDKLVNRDRLNFFSRSISDAFQLKKFPFDGIAIRYCKQTWLLTTDHLPLRWQYSKDILESISISYSIYQGYVGKCKSTVIDLCLLLYICSFPDYVGESNCTVIDLCLLFSLWWTSN